MVKQWRLPYSLPKLSDEEFERQKAEYVAKYGYTVYVPGWEDIVHLPLDNRFTEQEELRWAAKDWDFFTPQRLEELKAIKEMRKKMYQRLLGSPQPKIFRFRGSLLTALDNNQDALSTLSFILRIAYSTVPLAAKRWLTGPVGWIMTASDILNFCTYIMTPERSSLGSKRIKDSVTNKNPFSLKARRTRAKKLFSQKIGAGTLVEVLQTTDQLFGYGITLGAIMNLPFDMFFGAVRSFDGKPVTLLKPMDSPNFWGMQASLAWKSLATLFTTQEIWNVAEVLPMLICSHLMAVAYHVIYPSLNPVDQEIDFSSYYVKALEPKKVYLREIMEEEGDDPDGFTGWPLTEETWSSCTRISNEGNFLATTALNAWAYENRYSMEAFYGSQRAADAAMFMLATTAGDDGVEYDYISAEKTTHAVMNAKYRLPYNLTLNSGFYKKEEDYNLADIKEDYTKDLDKYFDFKNGIAEYKEEYLTEITLKKIIEGVSKWVTTKVQVSGIPDHVKIAAGLTRSAAATVIQQYFHFREFMYIKNLQRSPFAVATIDLPTILEYFKANEYYDTTPTTPQFLDYLDREFGIKLPVNETTGETLTF